MKKIISTLIFCISVLLISANNISVYYYYSTFFNPESGSYIETYTTVIGNSVSFKKNENNKYQSVVEITLLFKQDNVVKEFKKYNLKSPEITDTTQLPNFIDLQRINLKDGVYNFELKVKDLQNENSKEFSFYDIITINHKFDEVEISGIEYLEKYYPTEGQNILTRNGFDMVPYVADYYPSNINKFTFYFELYNTVKVLGDNTDFLLKYYLESTNNKAINNEFARTKKIKTKEIIPVLGEFDIEKLPTGNYNFAIEVLNKEGKIVASKKVFFQRSKPSPKIDLNNMDSIKVANTFVEQFTNLDTLVLFVKTLQPISNQSEQNYAINAIKSNNLLVLQKYFYGFWFTRNSLNPKEEWEKYKAQVDYVNQLYGSKVIKGYQTDRGRVYLQYGAPSSFVKRDSDNDTYPYEIWHYYSYENQGNIIFLFYNPELAGKNYSLIYTTAKGEVYVSNIDFILKKLYRGRGVLPEKDWSNNLSDDLRKEGIKVH